MIDFQFNIFGVPNGFDLYNGTPDKIKEFQTYYDSDCHETEKMIIHRKPDGAEVSYVYLRYNMISYDCRPNSFFGLALTTSDGKYCTDVQWLLSLFQQIYSQVSRNIFLTTDGINPSMAQAKYLVPAFAHNIPAINAVERWLIGEVSSHSERFASLDQTFRNGVESVAIKNGMNFNTKSDDINAALKSAGWVHLAWAEPKPDPVPRPDPKPDPKPDPVPRPEPKPLTITERIDKVEEQFAELKFHFVGKFNKWGKKTSVTEHYLLVQLYSELCNLKNEILQISQEPTFKNIKSKTEKTRFSTLQSDFDTLFSNVRKAYKRQQMVATMASKWWIGVIVVIAVILICVFLSKKQPSEPSLEQDQDTVTIVDDTNNGSDKAAENNLKKRQDIVDSLNLLLEDLTDDELKKYGDKIDQINNNIDNMEDNIEFDQNYNEAKERLKELIKDIKKNREAEAAKKNVRGKKTATAGKPKPQENTATIKPTAAQQQNAPGTDNNNSATNNNTTKTPANPPASSTNSNTTQDGSDNCIVYNRIRWKIGEKENLKEYSLNVGQTHTLKVYHLNQKVNVELKSVDLPNGCSINNEEQTITIAKDCKVDFHVTFTYVCPKDRTQKYVRPLTIKPLA